MKHSPVFATKDCLIYGMGGFSENVVSSMLVKSVELMQAKKREIPKLGPFCDRFFPTAAQAAKWIHVPDGPVNFKEMELSLPSAYIMPLAVDNTVAVGAVVVTSTGIERRVFDNATDYVNFLNEHACRFAHGEHAVFRLMANERAVAEKWSCEFGADRTDQLTEETKFVEKWRK